MFAVVFWQVKLKIIVSMSELFSFASLSIQLKKKPRLHMSVCDDTDVQTVETYVAAGFGRP